MALFLIALLAGILTVLSPCVLPLLPVIVGGSISGERSFKRALTVTLALGVSVFVFTLVLKVLTIFINVPPSVWTDVSGGIIIIVGLFMLFPKLFDMIPFIAKLNAQSSTAMNKGFMQRNLWGDIVIGASLGPVFSSCSPTYFIVLATVLPASLAAGLADIFAYIIGLCLSLLLVSFVGQKILDRLNVASDPNGWFKRVVGALFIIVGLLIATGLFAKIEAPLYSIFDETQVEQHLLETKSVSQSIQNLQEGAHGGSATSTANGFGTTGLAPMPESSSTAAAQASSETGANGGADSGALTPALAAILAKKSAMYPKAPELVSPDGYINTGGQPITLAQYRGKDVVLIDFWTYSCINCQRTIPYLNAWYGKYQQYGLVIIGVSTPEFAFEHVLSNVQSAVTQFGIHYPVVLDNEYKTWNAYQNEYWPHEYLVDIDGYIVHDHIGEGGYNDTETAIQAALMERATRLGLSTTGIQQPLTNVAEDNTAAVNSPETYFGSNRNQYLGNGSQLQSGTQTLTIPSGTPQANILYLGGSWNFQPEYAETNDSNETVEYTYTANDFYIVASANSPVTVTVLQDGQPVGSAAGADVNPSTSTVTVQANRLYKLVHNATPGTHTIELKISGPGFEAYTLDFG
jgi:cytochrome c biogenesis protein CcdA/thiol-disulfide isomerase/thioredoxin